jgi:hypothetical protein
MRTLGLLSNGEFFTVAPCHTLVIGTPGVGKTHLALKMAFSDFCDGSRVVYIDTEHDENDQFIHHHLQSDFQRVLPHQINLSTLNADTTLAAQLHPGQIAFPFQQTNATTFPPYSDSAFTVIKLGWETGLSYATRGFIVGCLLQYFASLPEPISIFVDDLDLFVTMADHPIFEQLLSASQKVVTLIVQGIDESLSSHQLAILQQIPLTIVCGETAFWSAQQLTRLFENKVDPHTFLRMPSRSRAIIKYQSEIVCIDLPQDNVTI